MSMVSSVVRAASENPQTPQAKSPLNQVPKAKKVSPSNPRIINEMATQRICSRRCKTA